MTKKWMIPGVLAVSLIVVGMAPAAPEAASIDRWVIGSGGGSGTAGGLSLSGTVGQWAVGGDEVGDFQLAPGFWGGGWDQRYSLYLPMVLSNTP